MSDLLLAAVLAAMPLPLTGLVPWWAAGLYSIPLAWQAWRARGGRVPASLDLWLINVLSVACLILFIADMAFLSRGWINISVHFTLSLIAVMAFYLQNQRDRAWFALLAFFLAVAGAANSTHPLLALHLLVLLGLFIAWLLQATGLPPGPARRAAALLTLACLALAAPMFLLLPRLRNPYVPGGGQRTGEAQTFSLDSLGIEGMVQTKNDQRVALRVRFDGTNVGEESLRLLARTFTEFRKGNWSNPAVRYQLRRLSPDGLLWLGRREGLTRRSMEAFPKDLSPKYLPLPYGVAGIEARLAYAHVGGDGTVRLSTWVAQRQFRYRAFIDPDAAPVPAAWSAAHLDLPAGMERELRDLAEHVMPEALPPRAQIEALVGHFAADYRYALEDYSAVEDPLREFLFVRKRGHCELYATACALLLRTRGIPARVAAGFMGGEANPLQDYYIIRFRNAHAWVEAWLDGSWTVVDPTPARFRPALERGTLTGQARFLWETLSFFWDRYVIGFAFPDQVDLARTLEDLAGGPGRVFIWGFAALTLAGAGAWAARRIRAEAHVLRRYRRLRRSAARAIGAAESALPPEAVERTFREREPALGPEAADFFNHYRRSSFGLEGEKGRAGDAAHAYRKLLAAAGRWGRAPQRPR